MRETFQKKLKVKADRITVLLIGGILLLCIGFLISNCGSGPTLKTLDPDAGNYAIYFGTTPPSPGKMGYVSACLGIPDMTNRDFTIEAWIKPDLGNTVGNIWARAGYVGGVVTHLNTTNIPCITTASSTGFQLWTTLQACASSSPLTADQWSHVAFVMCNSDLGCDDGHATTSPHLDVYVNGALAASAGAFNSRAWNIEVTPGNPGDPLNEWIGRRQNTFAGINGALNQRTTAVMDEVRFWSVARTQAQIQECKDRELGVSGGNCSIGSTGIIGYWKFNEGKGDTVYDSSGNGNNGGIRYCFTGAACWYDSAWSQPNVWTSGYQF